MRKLIIIAVFMASAAGGGYAHEMPEAVQRFLDNYTIDSTARWGPLHFRGGIAALLPDSIRTEDLRLIVLQEHWFRRDISFNDYSDTVTLRELIEPGFLWRVLVMAHGEPIYELWLNSRTGKPIIQQSNVASRRHPIWGPLLRVYSELTDTNSALIITNPVLIIHDELSISYPFFYFELLGPRKIYYTDGRGLNTAFDSLFTRSIEDLDDSKILIRYLKEREINERANRIERNAPHENIQNIERNENSEIRIESPAIFIEGNLMRDFPPAKNNQ
jgi:hypothetical protein